MGKLLKVAESQQKILQKLAQIAVQDPNIDYLKRAWQTAAVNSGAGQSVTPTIEATPGRTEGDVHIGETYTVYAADVPANNDLRRKLLDTFKAQIKSQKPDLDGKVGVIFGKKQH